MSTFRYVVSKKFMGVAYLLMDSGVDIFTAFDDALAVGKFQLALTLLSKTTAAKLGARRAGSEETLLHVLASAVPQLEQQAFPKFACTIADVLTGRFGLDPFSLTADGESWLHLAARSGNSALVKHILSRPDSPQVDAVNARGETPLACAVAAAKDVSLRAQALTVKTLVAAGASSAACPGMVLGALKRAPARVASPVRPSKVSDFTPQQRCWLTDAAVAADGSDSVREHRGEEVIVDVVESATVRIRARRGRYWSLSFVVPPESLSLITPEGVVFVRDRLDADMVTGDGPLAAVCGSVDTMCAAYVLCKVLQLDNCNVNEAVELVTPMCYLVQAQRAALARFFLVLCRNVGHDVDLNARVLGGTTLLHLTVRGGTLEEAPLYTAEDVKMLQLLVDHGAKVNSKDAAGKPPIHYAYLQASGTMRDALIKAGATDPKKPPKRPEVAVPELRAPAPVEADLQQALERYAAADKAAQAAKAVESKSDPTRTEVDPLSKLQGIAAVTLDGSGAMYNVRMSKTDVEYGDYGKHEFYRMQVLYNDVQDIFTLWTRWGRVGEDGQHQLTPYPTRDHAVAEFLKTFKSKTGNAWDKRDDFTPVPGRWTLQQGDDENIREKQQKLLSHVDFKRVQDSPALSPALNKLMRILSDVEVRPTRELS